MPATTRACRCGSVARSGRLLGVRRVGQLNAHIPSFAYERGLERLFGEPPAWPEPTRGVAEIRLEIRYRPTGALRRRLSDTATLYLDIVDYPGEWLLDLPLLELDYRQWSARCSPRCAIPWCASWPRHGCRNRCARSKPSTSASRRSWRSHTPRSCTPARSASGSA